MSAVINKAILSLKVIRPELEISTQLEKIYFHGEEDPWRVVVENLLDNSIRYATHEIVITLNEKELTVANDGPLMSEERLNKLFKPYEKGTDGKFGLGLSIVYRVCTTYGDVYKRQGQRQAGTVDRDGDDQKESHNAV